VTSAAEWQSENEAYWTSVSAVAEVLGSCVGSIGPIRALDLGCGSGLGRRLLSSIPGVVYTGVDISPGMVAKARTKFPDELFLNCAMTSSKLEPSSYELVMLLFTVFSFEPCPEDLARRIFDWLSPGGSVYVSALSRFSLRRIARLKFGQVEHYRTRGYSGQSQGAPAVCYTPSSLRDLFLEAGFTHRVHNPIGVASGLCEVARLFAASRYLARRVPWADHQVDFVFTKGSE
jgi:SAM-dependent methyltransferase